MLAGAVSQTAEDALITNSAGQRILHVRALALSGFRNYSAQRLEVSHQPVVLTGRNGSGKTNILEALSLLTPGRGIRRAKISELDMRGNKAAWVVSARAVGMQGGVQLGTGREAESFEDSDKRVVRIDGRAARGQAELAQHLSMIWLTPQMEQLFHEGASAGRKFLDRLVFSFDAEHAARVNEYEYAMRERNKLLSQYQADSAWLDALEQTMAETGAAIAQARLSTVEHINAAIAHSPLSFPKAELSIKGLVEDALAVGQTSVEAEEGFKTHLRGARRLDGAAGRTLAGVHRSEMGAIHVIKQIPAEYCSTGEQKALLLSVVLAQARAGAQWRGVVPVLLLDEVVAHLDATRRLELFEEICQIGAQTWMTGTDASLFNGLEASAQFFTVASGTCERTA